MKDDILIIGPSWVGDMVMAQVLFRMLKANHPQSNIDVLAPLWSAPLTSRMPEIRKSIPMPLKHGQLGLKERYHLGKSLKGRYTNAYILPNSFKSALVPFFARIPSRVGFRGEFRDLLLTDTKKLNEKELPLMIQRFAALASIEQAKSSITLPRPKLQVQEASCLAALAKFGLNTEQPILALCPGAEFGASKRWPVEKYIQVAQFYQKKGWAIWVFGSANDAYVAAQIQAAVPVMNLTGKTSLAEAIDLLSKATAVVTNDSGLMHIAAALNRPLVALYGSTDPGFTPPLAEQVLIHQLHVPCGPCFKRECPLGHHLCMKELSIEPVLEAIERFGMSS